MGQPPLLYQEPVQVMFIGAVLDAVNECEAGNSPPDTGGVDATSRRSREAPFNGADGVVKNGTSTKKRIPKHFGNPDHPVCAATPPVSGGEWRPIHSHLLWPRGHRPRLQELIRHYLDRLLENEGIGLGAVNYFDAPRRS